MGTCVWTRASLSSVCQLQERPNESVAIYDYGRGKVAEGPDYESVDRSFRPSSATALRTRKLVHFSKAGQASGYSVIVPTQAGLDHYHEIRNGA